jgi:hypothetical protein
MSHCAAAELAKGSDSGHIFEQRMTWLNCRTMECRLESQGESGGDE